MELEDLEGKNDFPKSESLELAKTLSETEKNYISEAIESNNSEFIISRIDEITCAVPPKAIDSNEEISALLEKNKGKIDVKYLEAPNDIEQATKEARAMVTMRSRRNGNTGKVISTQVWRSSTGWIRSPIRPWTCMTCTMCRSWN